MLTHSWCTNVFIIFTTVLLIFLSWVKWSQTYWSRKGLCFVPPTFFFGSAGAILMQKQAFGDLGKQLYDYIKSKGKPHGGFYFLLKPTYMPVDPEIVRHIVQKDFEHFFDRGVYYNEDVDPLSAHLFSLEGTKWRNLRAKLTPTFTPSKMRMMFDILMKCGHQMVAEMGKTTAKAPMDTKNMTERFTTDVIANCAFGIDCNSLENPNEEYPKYFKMFFVRGFWDHFSSLVSFASPEIAQRCGLRAVNRLLSDFFTKIITDTVRYREENNIYRKDFMHMLIQLKNRGKLEDDGEILQDNLDVNFISMNELLAQAFIFFAGGFETTSNSLTFCLFELASNPEIQEKLRQEVQKYSEITYDALMKMHYMEQVINETLRKYPPLPALNRVCTKEYKVPGTGYTVPENSKVWISVLGLHRDPEYYPDPEKFDPERFSEENRRRRPPGVFLPFGEGPRICIGRRFGVMQAKVALSVLLKHFRFSVSSETRLPLKFAPESFMLTAKGGIWLDYVKV